MTFKIQVQTLVMVVEENNHPINMGLLEIIRLGLVNKLLDNKRDLHTYKIISMRGICGH